MRAGAAPARAFLAANVALGSAAVAVASIARADVSLATLGLLAAAAILTELVQIPSDTSSPAPGDAHSFSFSTCVHVAAILLAGPWTGALVAALGVLVVDRLRGAAWRFVAFNASVFALATLAGGFAFEGLGGTRANLVLPGDFTALLGLAVTYYVVNTVLTCGMVALDVGSPFRPLAWGSFLDGASSFTAEAGLGIVLAVLARTQPWALVVVGPLLFAVYRSHERLATIRRATTRALETFATVVDHRDPYTFEHSTRVAEYARGLAHELGFPLSDVERLRWAGRLHDLGKIGVDASVLCAPGKLDAEDWEALRRHPRLSAHLLRRFRLAADEARAVEFHHERYDGRGYYAMPGAALPLAAHFLVVADSFDAMTSTRSYRAALPREEALAEIERNLGTQFHPLVGKAFVAWQRGQDPRSVLTAEEARSLRRLWTDPDRRERVRRGILENPDAVVIGSITLALAAHSLGGTRAGLAAVALAVSAFGARASIRSRTRELTRSLAAALSSEDRAAAVSALGARVSAAGPLTWAGIVAWNQQELATSVEVGWAGGREAPPDELLAGWLAREVDPDAELVVTKEPGGRETLVAVPLRAEHLLTGYFVLRFAGRLPTRLAAALRASASEISTALARPREVTTPTAPRLVAVR
ncbi:MAG: HD domain-containing protein [Thermoleophilia bacterium]|nr:HD domain-containing protein [Thermoleophilia bacterium]